MNIAVTGATGFIGRWLVAALRGRGDQVFALTRDPARARGRLGESVECVEWSPGDEGGAWRQVVGAADAVINLAGEPVGERRWNDALKKRIRESRVNGTRAVASAVLASPRPPKVLLSASGVDYYKDLGDEVVDESGPPGDSFLSEVTRAWEEAAKPVAERGVREVRLRIGLVVGEAGGAMERMVTPFKLGVGGKIGSGKQWVSWIQLQDAIGLMLDALDRESYTGPVNLVAPNPVRMGDFAKELGRALHRPSFMPVPNFALRMVMGEMAEVVLGGHRVVPAAALRNGYVFRHPELGPALRATFDQQLAV